MISSDIIGLVILIVVGMIYDIPVVDFSFVMSLFMYVYINTSCQDHEYCFWISYEYICIQAHRLLWCDCFISSDSLY